MATPIKETPILYGSSSKKFNKMLMSEQNDKVSALEKERIEALVRFSEIPQQQMTEEMARYEGFS